MGIYKIVATGFWIFGIILAKGFWSTFFAVICPLWAWYLAAEYLLTKYMVI